MEFESLRKQWEIHSSSIDKSNKVINLESINQLKTKTKGLSSVFTRDFVIMIAIVCFNILFIALTNLKYRYEAISVILVFTLLLTFQYQRFYIIIKKIEWGIGIIDGIKRLKIRLRNYLLWNIIMNSMLTVGFILISYKMNYFELKTLSIYVLSSIILVSVGSISLVTYSLFKLMYGKYIAHINDIIKDTTGLL